MKKSQPKKKKKKREKEINGEVVGYCHRRWEMGEEIKGRGYDLF